MFRPKIVLCVQGKFYSYLFPWRCAGEKWRVRRKLIAPEFRPSTLESSVQILNSNLDNLLNRLATFVGGPEFDVHPFMNLHAFDNVYGELGAAYHNALL
jgi:cytochrome P450